MLESIWSNFKKVGFTSFDVATFHFKSICERLIFTSLLRSKLSNRNHGWISMVGCGKIVTRREEILLNPSKFHSKNSRFQNIKIFFFFIKIARSMFRLRRSRWYFSKRNETKFQFIGGKKIAQSIENSPPLANALAKRVDLQSKLVVDPIAGTASKAGRPEFLLWNRACTYNG